MLGCQTVLMGFIRRGTLLLWAGGQWEEGCTDGRGRRDELKEDHAERRKWAKAEACRHECWWQLAVNCHVELLEEVTHVFPVGATVSPALSLTC